MAFDYEWLSNSSEQENINEERITITNSDKVKSDDVNVFNVR